ncbi:hypothetical protein VE03_06382 [Pseudogymnoascus sp. 23342-1-I1]|nr:hypothetical protein VE03_06382 [Pseudogymnoascus sp. 23342-1-I1]
MDTGDCFALFSTLPTELRWKIWGFAMSAHFVVDFIPKLDALDFPVATGELHPVRPILSMDNSRISQACKEAWRLIQGPYRKIELAGRPPYSRYHYVDHIDFSRTTFYLHYGKFSFNCIDTMVPEPISAHVKMVAIPWSNYGELISTCKRLILFPALQRIVILVPPDLNPRLPPPFCATMTMLDLYLQGKIYQILDPHEAGSHLRDEVDKFVQYYFAEHGLQCPAVEAVFVPDLV